MTKQYEVKAEGGVELNGTHYEAGHVFDLDDPVSEQVAVLIDGGSLVELQSEDTAAADATATEATPAPETTEEQAPAQEGVETQSAEAQSESPKVEGSSDASSDSEGGSDAAASAPDTEAQA